MSVCAAACTQGGPRFDLIVRGGDVIDGSGQPARRADVGIAGDRITAIGDLASAAAGRVIDASGLVVAPGFIDVQGQSGTTLLADNFKGWRDAVRGCLDDAGNRLPADLDRAQLASFVLTVMEGAVMQARTERSLKPFDDSVTQLRDYFERITADGTQWGTPPGITTEITEGTEIKNGKRRDKP